VESQRVRIARQTAAYHVDTGPAFFLVIFNLCLVDLTFGCSENFLTLEIFFGKLMTQEVIQLTSYDGFAFFCKLFPSVIYISEQLLLTGMFTISEF